MRMSRMMAIMSQGGESGTPIGDLSLGDRFYLKENGTPQLWQVVEKTDSTKSLVLRYYTLDYTINILETYYSKNFQRYNDSDLRDEMLDFENLLESKVLNNIVSVSKNYDFYNHGYGLYTQSNSDKIFIWNSADLPSYFNTTTLRRKQTASGSSYVDWWLWDVDYYGSTSKYYARYYVDSNGQYNYNEFWVGGGSGRSDITAYPVPAMYLNNTLKVKVL